MTLEASQTDLLVLAADKNARLAFEALLSRHQSIGIRPVLFKVEQHPEHDAGCRTKGVAYLRPTVHLFRHALLVFDHEGCGQESRSASDITRDLDAELSRSGWGDRARTIVMEPELEAWVWSGSPHVLEALGWRGNYEDLKREMGQQGYWLEGRTKPHRPKEALELALRRARKARSSALYQSIAGKVSFAGCRDPAFGALLAVLRTWFGEVSG
jgi:hypothetical protein